MFICVVALAFLEAELLTFHSSYWEFINPKALFHLTGFGVLAPIFIVQCYNVNFHLSKCLYCTKLN